jgi:hypothetical protein
VLCFFLSSCTLCVNQKRTNNTMTKRKRTNNDLKTEKNTQKTKDEQHESHQKPGRNLVGSTYERFCIKFSQSRMKGERHRLSPQPLVLDGCSFSWFISGFVTRVTRRVSLVEQEVLSLSEHQSSPQVFGGIRVARLSFSANLSQVTDKLYHIMLYEYILA